MATNGFRGRVALSVGILFAFCVAAAAVSAQERPEALRDLVVQDGYLATSFKEVGSILRIVGKGCVVVLHRSTGEAFYASEGDPVHENDAVYTLGTARCRITFHDRNVVTMAPQSDLIIEEITQSLSERKKKSLFETTKGRVVFYAIRLFSFRDVQMKVKTPTATVGVRGTKFGTEIREMPLQGGSFERNSRVASLEPMRLAAAPTGNWMVNIYVAQGTVEVVSLVDNLMRAVGENEWIGSGPLGLEPVIYAPDRVRSFMDSVEGPLVDGREPGASPVSETGGQGVQSSHDQEENARRLEEIEDIKQMEMERDIEKDYQPPSEPSHRPSPPSGGGCTCP